MEKLESIMDNFENQTIKRQNSVDRTLADHTIKLLELTHNLNKTKGTSQFNLNSDTQCNYYKPRQRTSAAISETRTPWYPTEDDSDVVSAEIFSTTFWTKVNACLHIVSNNCVLFDVINYISDKL